MFIPLHCPDIIFPEAEFGTRLLAAALAVKKGNPHAIADILSDGTGGSKWMEVGKPNTVFQDITGHVPGLIHTNADGWAEFHCKGGSVSVWVEDQTS